MRLLTVVLLLGSVGCASTPTAPAPSPVASEALSLPSRQDLADAARQRSHELKEGRMKAAAGESLALQDLIAEARRYEAVLELIARSDRPNPSQVFCLESRRSLNERRLAAEERLAEWRDLEALGAAGADLGDALVIARECVANYGEIAFAYFQLDRSQVPGGLNPRFAVENELLFAKLSALCGEKDSVVHLYGYSCDLGSPSYSRALALERARRLEDHLDLLLAATCGKSLVRFESDLGGVIELVDPAGRPTEELEAQRERHRVVTLFMFNQD